MANMKETVTRPLSPLVQTSDTGQTSGIVTSETSNDNGPSIKTNNNKSNKKEAICLQPKTSEKITATSTVKSRGKGTGKAKNVIERETLPSTALRCVSLAFLLRFTDHYKLWHHLTKDVVGEVIVPLSKQQQCVWSDIDPSISLLQPDDIAPPQIFVSHAWTNSWGLLVLGVKAYAEFNKVSAEKLTCWIDIFVINQHNYMQELKQLDRVIEVCGNFIQIIDSECAVPLTRVWCLYEVMSRLKHKKSGGLTVTVASITPPSESQSIDTCSDVDGNIDNKVEITSHNAADSSAVTTTITSTPVRPTLLLASQNRIDTVLKQVNMEKAQATYPEDVEKILNLVRTEIPGGFSTVNAQVREALVRNSVLNMFQNAAGAAGSKVVRKGEKKGRHKAGGKSSGITCLSIYHLSALAMPC